MRTAVKAAPVAVRRAQKSGAAENAALERVPAPDAGVPEVFRRALAGVADTASAERAALPALERAALPALERTALPTLPAPAAPCPFGVPARLWNDWRWQLAHRVTTAEALARWLPLSDAEQRGIAACLERFRMAITPYYLSLIDPTDPCDPVRMQAVPSTLELAPDGNDLADPLNEEGDSPVPHIVHRYPDRVLFLVTFKCAMYCRHCTRRRAVGEEDRVIGEKDMRRALDYIRAHTEIRDVLISGGDPLTLSTPRLERIIAALREIPHVDIIRIGTRAPVVLPMRVDAELLAMLRKYQPIWINTHFNHPRELTPEAARACAAIVDAGIPLGNQSVLLRGVNDDADTMKRLLLGLVHLRVRPYYLYQCDLSRGIGHFRTRVETGVDILHALQGNISGYAVPRFVIDAPGGGGKIPVGYPYVLSRDDSEVVLENYRGDVYRYPQPKRER